MISQPRFVSKLRALGYRFKSRTKSLRNDLYRKAGGSHCVFLPRTDFLLESYVRSTLAQCGLSQKEVDQFISEGKPKDKS
jgi:hypothetical protein